MVQRLDLAKAGFPALRLQRMSTCFAASPQGLHWGHPFEPIPERSSQSPKGRHQEKGPPIRAWLRSRGWGKGARNPPSQWHPSLLLTGPV